SRMLMPQTRTAMHVLDENLDDGLQDELRRWRIRTHKIGKGVGRLSMGDEEIIPLLHGLKSVTFFTDDQDYYQRKLCHGSYCLVWLDVGKAAVEEIIRDFLRHPAFRTWAKRKGKVIWVRSSGMRFWQLHAETEQSVAWPG